MRPVLPELLRVRGRLACTGGDPIMACPWPDDGASRLAWLEGYLAEAVTRFSQSAAAFTTFHGKQPSREGAPWHVVETDLLVVNAVRLDDALPPLALGAVLRRAPAAVRIKQHRLGLTAPAVTDRV